MVRFCLPTSIALPAGSIPADALRSDQLRLVPSASRVDARPIAIENLAQSDAVVLGRSSHDDLQLVSSASDARIKTNERGVACIEDSQGNRADLIRLAPRLCYPQEIASKQISNTVSRALAIRNHALKAFEGADFGPVAGFDQIKDRVSGVWDLAKTRPDDSEISVRIFGLRGHFAEALELLSLFTGARVLVEAFDDDVFVAQEFDDVAQTYIADQQLDMLLFSGMGRLFDLRARHNFYQPSDITVALPEHSVTDKTIANRKYLRQRLQDEGFTAFSGVTFELLASGAVMVKKS